MSDKATRPEFSEREEETISSIQESIDFGEFLVNDHVDAEVEVVTGRMSVKYRSPFSGDVFEIDEEVREKKIESPAEEYNYRIFRSLASAVISINGEDFMPGAGIGTKISGLRRKSKHLLERMLWGNVLFNEAIKRTVENPDAFSEEVKK